MRRILIADDDPTVCALLSRELEEAGYRVETVSDGRAALAEITAAPPDLLITDLLMPDLTGWSLFARVRQRAPSLPIIVVSGVDAGVPQQDASLADDAVYLRKPIDLDHLLAVVAGMMTEDAC